MLISQAKIVNEGKAYEADVLVHKGRIEKVAPFIAAPPKTKVLDAKGKLLLPGVIDDQVHFREPGFPHKADIATESAAGVAGGTTSFMEMPNSKPITTDYTALADKYERASKKSAANYAFYFGATNDNLELIRNLDPRNQQVALVVRRDFKIAVVPIHGYGSPITACFHYFYPWCAARC